MKVELKNDLIKEIHDWIGDYAFAPICNALVIEMTQNLDNRILRMISENSLDERELEFPLEFSINDLGVWKMETFGSKFSFTPIENVKPLGVKKITNETI